MYKKTYKCTFLADIILNSESHTEGSQQSLDYIPGSNFLGIVAKYYNEFGNEKAYDIFHSGKVRFGDAHISVNNERSLKQPASWYYKKGDDKVKEIYLHHLIDDDRRKKLMKYEIQLKQIRTGYFKDNIKVSPKHNFAIKSAHDSEKRKSMDEQMFGYDSLARGTEWIFTVEADDKELLNMVAEKLIGEKNIGRSKTAEYGRVKIEEIENKDIINQVKTDNFALLYFESRVAFIDENGNPTFQPTIEQLGLKRGNIDWEKSQILTKTFSPWNAKRKTRDADRVCIDKGSVIYVSDCETDEEKIKKGLGVYINEGFGRVLINPDFLFPDKDGENYKRTAPEINNKIQRGKSSIIEKGEKDSYVLSWIEWRKKINKRYSDVVKFTNDFISNRSSKFKDKGISSSQWGAVRERAQREKDFNKINDGLFGNDDGFLLHGKTANKWRGKYKILKDAIDNAKTEASDETARRFLINLCSEMAKRTKKEV